jgi:hypothetical protein
LAGRPTESEAGTATGSVLERVAEAAGIEPDDLRLVVATIRLRLPKGSSKREHAVCLSHSCSPMYDASLGRAGMILWMKGLVVERGKDEADRVILLLPKCIGRQDEDALTKEILGTWEAYS